MGFDWYFIIALVVAVTVHECSHAAAAYYLGDPTAKYQGRLTLNPFAHLDLMGTLMLFLVGLGWGKPVPVNPYNLHHPKRDSALISLAGPGSNIILAIMISLPYKILFLSGDFPTLTLLFRVVFDLNIYLALFNFVPLPPLDGSKIIGILIPDRYYPQYQHFLEDGLKYFIAFILIDSFVLAEFLGFSLLSTLMRIGYDILSSIILFGT